MAKRDQSSATAKNKHGNVDIPMVERSALGTKEFPLSVYRGTKGEAGVWIARIALLPGYLGWGESEAAAIACLWQEIGDGPVYDVRGAHRLAPTSANIRYVLEHAERVHEAKLAADALGSRNSESLAKTAVRQRVSRNALTSAIARDDMWQSMGGIDAYVASLGQGHVQQANELACDPQAYFENHPERAEYFLARLKFPSARKAMGEASRLKSSKK